MVEQAISPASQAELIDLAYAAMLVRDMHSRIIFWNREAERVYGWSKDEALGRISHELLHSRFPDTIWSRSKRRCWRRVIGRARSIHVTRDGRELSPAEPLGAAKRRARQARIDPGSQPGRYGAKARRGRACRVGLAGRGPGRSRGGAPAFCLLGRGQCDAGGFAGLRDHAGQRGTPGSASHGRLVYGRHTGRKWLDPVTRRGPRRSRKGALGARAAPEVSDSTWIAPTGLAHVLRTGQPEIYPVCDRGDAASRSHATPSSLRSYAPSGSPR